MQPLDIGLVTADPALRAAVRKSAHAVPVVDLTGGATEVGAAQLDALLSRRLAAVLLDLGSEPELSLRLAEYLARQPGIGAVMAIGPEPSAALLLDALRAGVGEYLTAPASPAAIEEALLRLAGRRPDTDASPAGRVCAIVGANGGVGTTTLAVNVAQELSRTNPGAVLLADLDAGRGDAELHLGVDPRFSIVDFMENLHRMDAPLLASFVERHDSGLHFLRSPAAVAAVDAEAVGPALAHLRQQYRFIILDTPDPFTPAGAAALAAADDIMVVVTQELPSVRNVTRVAAQLERAGGERNALRLVVNRYDSRGLPLEEIARHTGLEVVGQLPANAGAAVRAVSEGRSLADAGGALAREIRQLAARLGGGAKAASAQPRRWTLAGLLRPGARAARDAAPVGVQS